MRYFRISNRQWSFAPLHDPAAIALIREMMKRFPQARHYACFDTVFHQTMPAEASTYAIPAKYREQGCAAMDFMGFPVREWCETCGLHQTEGRRVFHGAW